MVCCRPDTDRLFTKEQTGGLKALFLISSPATDGVPRLSSSPVTLPVWVLFYLAVLCCFIRSLSGCYEGLGWRVMQLGLG